MDNPYPLCENCIFVDEPLDKDPCQECNRAFLAQRIKPNFVSKPQTNADRIRAMSDEELATFLCNNVDCAFCESIKGDCKVGCKDRMLLWLKAPVEVDE